MQLTFTAANCVQRRDTEMRPIDGLTLKRDQGVEGERAADKESTRVYQGQLPGERREMTGQNKKRRLENVEKKKENRKFFKRFAREKYLNINIHMSALLHN